MIHLVRNFIFAPMSHLTKRRGYIAGGDEMKNTQGVHKLLGIQDKRQCIADQALCEGRCQVKGCEDMAVKVVSFTSGHILSLCIKHLKQKDTESYGEHK